ncbi:hypothetical protein EX30DRAFT_361667 [Ascodesmis nigricans]|uniref:Uncharacterized protein n=1 Tax=Ascodesmis nigricans TaxID=341454 RepID=A0A4S2N3D0_9PEZI|nr:hypothetical protein EX30DRAFT_361667 [Ascodesmis nigricans]
MAADPICNSWILDVLDTEGFDEHDYFVGVAEFRRILSSEPVSQSLKDLAFSRLNYVLKINLGFANSAWTPNYASAPMTIREWIQYHLPGYGHEDGKFIGMGRFREKLFENCPVEAWKEKLFKVLTDMQHDMRFHQRRRGRLSSPQSNFFKCASAPDSESNTSWDMMSDFASDSDDSQSNYATDPMLDTWLQTMAMMVARRYPASPFVGFDTIQHDMEAMCPSDDWRQVISSRMDHLRRDPDFCRVIHAPPTEHEGEAPLNLYSNDPRLSELDDWILDSAEVALLSWKTNAATWASNRPRAWRTHIYFHLHKTCPHMEWRPLIWRRFNWIRHIHRPARWMLIMMRAHDIYAQITGAQHNLFFAPLDRITVPVEGVPGTEITIISEDPELDGWIVSSAVRVATHEFPFEGWNSIIEKLDKMCLNQEWKKGISDRITFLKMVPEFRRIVGAQKISPPTKTIPNFPTKSIWLQVTSKSLDPPPSMTEPELPDNNEGWTVVPARRQRVSKRGEGSQARPMISKNWRRPD